MKVLDLLCQQGHVFEGWFASEEDFQGSCAIRSCSARCALTSTFPKD